MRFSFSILKILTKNKPMGNRATVRFRVVVLRLNLFDKISIWFQVCTKAENSLVCSNWPKFWPNGISLHSWRLLLLCSLFLCGQKVSELNSELAEPGRGQIMPTTILPAPSPSLISRPSAGSDYFIPWKDSSSRRLDTECIMSFIFVCFWIKTWL